MKTGTSYNVSNRLNLKSNTIKLLLQLILFQTWKKKINTVNIFKKPIDSSEMIDDLIASWFTFALPWHVAIKTDFICTKKNDLKVFIMT